MIYDSGKAHHIAIPYIDENGIPQAPRFGISSFRGKAIREWAVKLYQQVVNEKRESAKFSSKVIKQVKPKHIISNKLAWKALILKREPQE